MASKLKFGRRIFLKALASLPLVGPYMSGANAIEQVVESIEEKVRFTPNLGGLPLPIVHRDFWFNPGVSKSTDREVMASESPSLHDMLDKIDRGVRRWWE